MTEETRLALEKLTNKKISAAMPVRAAEKTAPAQYIRYGVPYHSNNVISMFGLPLPTSLLLDTPQHSKVGLTTLEPSRGLLEW